MSALLHTPSVEPDTAAEARAIHLRRQLEAAAEHGAAMLAALGLPGLDALDEAIRVLDELDAPSTDLEPEPGYCEPEGDDERDGSGNASGFDDDEHTLGWNETVSQLELGRPCEDGDATALERHGAGFIRSGPEDSEDDELGDGRDPESLAWVFGPSWREVARHG